jgi:hypothetical protein
MKSAYEYSYRPGPYELCFMDEKHFVGYPSGWPIPTEDKTYIIWWGPEDARVGDCFRFNLPGNPCAVIESATLILGGFHEVSEIEHGHRFIVTFNETLGAKRPIGGVYYVRLSCDGTGI